MYKNSKPEPMQSFFRSIGIILPIILISAASCLSKTKLDKAAWLEGTWENKTSRGSIFENWKVVSETEMRGKSYKLQEEDTLVFETLGLIEEDGKVFLIPTVMNQNDQQPVVFTLTEISNSLMIFKRPEHDFPQVIEYRMISVDSLIAEISGFVNGEMRRSRFPMKRVY